MRTNTMFLAMSLLFVWAAPALSASQSTAAFPTVIVAQHNAMIGKKVLGKSREFLGDIVAVDESKQTADLKAPTGAVVPIPMEKLRAEEDHLRASTISRGDVLALIRETGQAGIFEVNTPTKPTK